MALLTGLSLKTLSAAGSTALVVGGGGTAAIIYRESIADFIKHGSSGNRESKEFGYIVATVAELNSATIETLYSTNHKTLKCAITVGDNTTTDRACSIYKLNESAAPDTIDFKDGTKTIKIENKSDLTANKQILVKVSSVFKTKLTNTQTTFQLLTNKGEKVADLKWEFDLNKDQTNSNTPITESSLLVIKLTGNATSSFANGNTTDNTYKCHFGTEDTTGIDCKVYKPTNESTPYTHTTLNTLTPIATSHTSLAKDSYLVIDLLNHKKSFADLDNKEISIKHSASEKAKGIIDNLLIGKIGTNGTNSMLFKVSDVEARQTVTLSGNKNHILTKFASKHIAASTTFPTEGLICRVVDENIIYEDGTCGLYKFGEAAKTALDLTTLTAEGQKINADTDITTDKYQLVKVDQKIIDKLNARSATPQKLEIIEKTKKTKAFNNQYASLDVKGLLTSGTTTNQTLYSNLFVGRVTVAGTDSTSAAQTNLKCTIESIAYDCKIYKQGTEAAGNAIGSTNLSSISDTLTPTTDLAVGKYAVIELTGTQKTLDDLKNKTVVVTKSDNAAYATLEFDQQLFGYTDTNTKYVVPLKAKEVSFIVTKGTVGSGVTEADTNIASTARCKFAAPTGQTTTLDNYDYSCKLSKITTPTSDKKLSTLDELKKLPTTGSSEWKLKGDNDGFYKLTFDAHKLYNIDLSAFADKSITIELAPTTGGGASTVYGVVNLKHNITATEAKGKTKLVVGKVSASPASGAVNLTGGKCYFDTDTSIEFDCTVHKNTASTKTELIKGVFTTAATSSETLAASEFFLFKLTEEKSISELTSKTQINYKSTGSNTTTTTMNIEAILGGDEATDKKLYVLHQKTSS